MFFQKAIKFLGNSSTEPHDRSLFHFGSNELTAVDSDLNFERRTKGVALYDSSASPHTAGQIRHLERIKNGMATRIAHHGMFRLKPVLGKKLLQISDVFKLTVLEWCPQ
jgi:hypothetical protein